MTKSEHRVVEGEIIPMNTETIKMTADVPGRTSEMGTNLGVIRWTRQADGRYRKEGTLPTELSMVRIFAIDEDSQTACPGQKLWPKEEAVALVERNIAEGSYREWRYEIRPEATESEVATSLPPVSAPQPPDLRLCNNPRCKKGPNGSAGILTDLRAKYCCASCRVDVCRRNRQKTEDSRWRTRKPRSDKKHPSHAARQKAYHARKMARSTHPGRRRRMIGDIRIDYT